MIQLFLGINIFWSLIMSFRNSTPSHSKLTLTGTNCLSHVAWLKTRTQMKLMIWMRIPSYSFFLITNILTPWWPTRSFLFGFQPQVNVAIPYSTRFCTFVVLFCVFKVQASYFSNISYPRLEAFSISTVTQVPFKALSSIEWLQTETFSSAHFAQREH